MKEILVVSGKGGSGKTSLTACFAQLAKNSLLIDCDVDASDLPLILNPTVTKRNDFFAGFSPKIDQEKCNLCQKCLKLCRFEAIVLNNKKIEIASTGCEGCGVCADNCPAEAIKMESSQCGYWMRSKTDYGVMYHAELFAGAENSGKLIAELRSNAKKEAQENNIDLILSDGPPGIGCPVISASTGVDYAVIVTEPTVSGVHDMQRVAQLLLQFEIPISIIINKSDLNNQVTSDIEKWCKKNKIKLLGKIPFNAIFSDALRAGKTVLDLPNSKVSDEIKSIWDKIPK